MARALAVVFIASFCTLVIELVAGRILAPYVGVSLYTWTSIIGMVLAGISLGAYLGGFVADRFPKSSTLGWLLFLSGLAALSIPPLVNWAGPKPFQTSLMIRILLLTAIVFFIPSCLLGMISPVIVRLVLRSLKQTGNVVGRIYAFSTLGSILGTFATGFFLISWLGTRPLLVAAGSLLILSAVVFGGPFTRKKAVGFLLLFLFGLVWAFYGQALSPPLDRHTLLFRESDYYTVRLSRGSEGEGDRDRLITLYLDNLSHSVTDLKDPFHLVFHYTRVYEELLRWKARQRDTLKAFFIGGGGYTIPRLMELKYPGAEIDVAEIDPAVTRVAQEYLKVPKDSRIRIHHQDGRWFVMNLREKEKYDLIFLDAFNDLSIPYHLTTKEFGIHLKEILKPDGLLLVNVIDSFKNSGFLRSYARTLEEVFGKDRVSLVTLSALYDYIGVSNFVLVASPGPLDMDDFVRTIEKEGKETMSRVMSRERLQQFLKEGPSVVLTDDYVPVDNLIAPIFEALYGYRR